MSGIWRRPRARLLSDSGFHRVLQILREELSFRDPGEISANVSDPLENPVSVRLIYEVRLRKEHPSFEGAENRHDFSSQTFICEHRI